MGQHYDQFINDTKHYLTEFPKYKKRAAEIEKHVKQLKEEKIAKDAERKKAGPSYKPTMKDQIFDAAYKKAVAAEGADPSRMIEEQLKFVKLTVQAMEGQYLQIKKEAETALADLDAMMKIFDHFVEMQKIAPLSMQKDQYGMFGKAFGDYFARLADLK